MSRRPRTGERGSASLELIGVALVLLVPMFYLVMTLARLQAGAYAVSGAARDAGRVFAESGDTASGRARASAAARVIFDDYGFDGGQADVTCLDIPCPGPDARVRADATVSVPLPLVPDLARSVVPTSITLHADHLATVERFRESP